MKSIICSAAALLLATTAADAARFDLSYTLSTGNTVSAVLDGDVSNGLFTVSQVEAISLNGMVVPDSYTAYSLDALSMGGSTATPGSFAIDGSFFDLYIWNGVLDPSTGSVFAIGVGNKLATLFQLSPVTASLDLGGSTSYDIFDAGAYSGRLDDTQPLPAPEPASWLMMLAGFGALGSVMRARRRATVTFA